MVAGVVCGVASLLAVAAAHASPAAAPGVLPPPPPPPPPSRPLQKRAGRPRRLGLGSGAIGADSACRYFTVTQVDASDAGTSYAYLNLDASFYKKVVTEGLVPVTGSGAVSDAALLAAARITTYMLAGRPDIVAVLKANRVHNVVMGREEKATAVPEHADLGPSWDWTRGLGATQWRPASSCAEENVMCDTSGDSFQGENILVHEFSHSMTNMLVGSDALRLQYPQSDAHPTIKQRETANYAAATGSGLWSNTYGGSNQAEYFAELTQSYFDVNSLGPKGGDGVHNDINTRIKFKAYDAAGYEMIENVFKSVPTGWRPGCGCTDADRKNFPLDFFGGKNGTGADTLGTAEENGASSLASSKFPLAIVMGVLWILLRPTSSSSSCSAEGGMATAAAAAKKAFAAALVVVPAMRTDIGASTGRAV